jgi:hypothetical protein
MRVVVTHLERRATVFCAVAASALIALLCAASTIGTISLFPPKVHAGSLQVAAATSQILVDFRQSKIVDRRATPGDLDSLTTRAVLVGRLMSSRPVVQRIGRRTGLNPDRIAAISTITANVQTALTEPGSEQRANEILLSKDPYRLEIQARRGSPIISVYSQAPSIAEAQRLANAAMDATQDYLGTLPVQPDSDPGEQVQLRRLGPARAAVVNGGAAVKIAGLTFVVVFVLLSGAVLLLTRRSERLPAEIERRPESRTRSAGGLSIPAWVPRTLSLSAAAAASTGPSIPSPLPVPVGTAVEAFRLRSARLAKRMSAASGGDWPRTTRVLPWMIAGFLAMLWLVPFNSIELTASLPIDLKLDRLVLPFIVLTWVLALAAGGRAAPGLRLTWVHAAVGAFVAIACLSVVLNARDLNHTLELDEPIKKLPLLLAYLTFFLMMSTIVRPSEVRPFLFYILGLAVICAIGMLWENRFQYNVFYDWSDKLLPGFFKVDAAEVSWDISGRRTTRGPTAHGLEAVAILSMALPIALVAVVHAKRRGSRLLFAIATCLLLAAVFATERKSALVVPASVILTLAYFRRRELLKMAPLVVPLLIAVQIMAPGTLGSTTAQFDSQRLGANTVSDRASDYDAIRPDLLTHPALGRGYGSYQPMGHRILDSEILVRTVETGVLGLAAYVLMMVSVVASARRTINSRHPQWAPSALMCAAASVAFLVVSTLFDVMAFPHAPYVFLSLAGLMAALLKSAERLDGLD